MHVSAYACFLDSNDIFGVFDDLCACVCMHMYTLQTSVTQEHVGLPSNRITNTFAYTGSNAQEFYTQSRAHQTSTHVHVHVYTEHPNNSRRP